MAIGLVNPEVADAPAQEAETPPEVPTPAVVEPVTIEPQTEEAVEAIIPPPISADDPRARRMFAEIAISVLSEGNANYLEEHYKIIADRLGAPQIKDLRESGHLVKAVKHKVQVLVDIENDSEPMPKTKEIRAALEKMLSKTDAELRQASNHIDRTPSWRLGD